MARRLHDRTSKRDGPARRQQRSQKRFEPGTRKPGQARGVGPLTRRIRDAINVDLSGRRAAPRLGKTIRDLSEDVVSKRTFQPHRKSRLRTHGFRKRMKSRSGREVIRRRRRKGRRQLTVSVSKK